MADQIDAIRLNNKGVESLKEENATLAQREFLKSLTEKPLQPEVKLNLGISFEDQKHLDKALKEYESVLRLAPEKSLVRMAALVNAANLYGARQKIDKALDYYQKALQIVPNSKEVKKNIELLWQKKSGGGGEGKQKKPQNQKNKKGQGPKPKPKPKKFKSKELSANDVKRILEEIKNQEQKIRAKEYQKNLKEPPRDKDW